MRAPIIMPKHQAHEPLTTRDLNKVQSNVDLAFGALTARIVLVNQEPRYSGSTGSRGDLWMGTNGTIKLCVSDNLWVLLQGVAF